MSAPGGARGAEAALVAVTLVWGASFLIVQAALEDASTVAFLAIRFAAAAMVLAVAWRRRLVEGGWRDGGAIGGAAAAGVALAVAYLLQTAGLRWTTASKSAFLTSLCVVLVPLLGALVYQSVPAAAELSGAGLAFIGMALLTLPAQQLSFNRGDLLTAGGAAAFACHILITGHYAARTGVAVLGFGQVAAAALLFGAAAPWAEPVRVEWSARLVAAVAVTSVLCTAVAYPVQAWAQQRISPVRAAVIFALEPVAAAATSFLVAGERLAPRAALGCALILGGVLAMELKPRGARLHPSS